MSNFTPQSRLTEVGKNILRKRYYDENEHKWKHVATRVINAICGNWNSDKVALMYDIIYNRYFVPSSPILANGGKERHAGLSACSVLPLEDTIEEIYKTKLHFALIARKGGGCGTTLSNLRPKGDPVIGSTHGAAGGPIPFADTISHDMEVISQGGFRSMALMFTMSVRHPDIMEFIHAKTEEGKIANANMSVMADHNFMIAVQKDETYWTEFGGKKYQELRSRDIFEAIVEGAWRNGEPAFLFSDTINENSPYRHAGVKIEACNPCGEQPLQKFGSCNLGSLDLSKFFRRGEFDWSLFETAIRMSVRFLDSVIDVNDYPIPEMKTEALKSRALGIGIMGLADYYMVREIAYGSDDALSALNSIGSFMWDVAKDESQEMGERLGVPELAKMLPVPRRNITLLTVAPTGTTSLIAGCNSGIEPFFSEITQRADKTGEYTINAEGSEKDYFRCAVASDEDKSKEVTWQEHVLTQAAIQGWVDSGISKTINFPQGTHRETIGKAFMLAWSNGCKGITVYRNGSRRVEVLTPKNIQKNLCPACEAPTKRYDGCTSCTECDWSLCTM